MEFGTALGLAQSGQYDQQINDLYRRKEADNRAEQLATAKAQLFAKDVEFMNAANRFDSTRVKEFAQKHIEKIGNYYHQNPDMMYNPSKMAQYKVMVSELKNNPDLVRGLASDNAYKSYLKDLEEVTKNPSMHDSEAYAQYQEQWKNYEMYGNQKGKEAAAAEGPQPFTYSRPQMLVDLDTELPKIGNSIKNKEYKNGPMGELYADASDTTLNAAVTAVLSDPAMRRTVELRAKKFGWSNEESTAFVKQMIHNGVENEYSPPKYLEYERLNLAKRAQALDEKKYKDEKSAIPVVTTWDDFVNPSFPAGEVDQKAITDIFGDTKIVVQGGNGKQIDLTGLPWKSDGKFVKGNSGKYKGVPFLSGQVEMPLEEAKSRGLIVDPWGWGDADPAPGFADRVTVHKSERNGKEVRYVTVKHEIKVDPSNQSHKSRYNQMTMPSKLVPGAQDRFSQPVRSATKQEWMAAGWSEDQINTAASQGKIKVQ